MDTIKFFFQSLRIVSWGVKNLLIFAATIFSLNIFRLEHLKNNLIAFFLFGLVTGSIYLFNDVVDRKSDQLHPTKCKRPIAAGKLKIRVAQTGALVMLLITLPIQYFFNFEFFLISCIYLVLNLSYTLFLKKIVILDVMVIAVGFVLRVWIGAAINNIMLYPWILIMTFLGALFIGLIKRRQELINLSSGEKHSETRETLRQYNLALLDQLISISTATTLISYIIYVLNPEIQKKFDTQSLFITVPFVVFGFFRYLYMTYARGEGENPTEIIFTDLPFIINILLWCVVFVILIKF